MYDKDLPSHGSSVVIICNTCSVPKWIPAPPLEDDSEAFNKSGDSSEKDEPKGEVMDVDPGQEVTSISDEKEDAKGKRRKRKGCRRKKPIKPWTPFFERKQHALFVGDERLNQSPGD